MTTTTIDRDSVLLEQGQYWRALEDIPSQHISKGMVLLLESIRDVDERAHTIILRPHPSIYGKSLVTKTEVDGEVVEYRVWELKEHRFLVDEFTRLFVEEPDFARIRREEVARLQLRVTELQEELTQASTHVTPELKGYLVQGLTSWEEKKQLPAGSSSVIATTEMVPLSMGLSKERVADMKLAAEQQVEVAALKANYLKERNEAISATVTAMLPYFQEGAAGALAKTEDVRRYVKRLQNGIQSLDLYVGTEVTVHTIRKGQDAAETEPLTIMQRKLFADEELSVFAEVDEEFDHSKIDTFFEALAERPGLVAQIFPTERCIVAYAATRRDRDYGDAWANGVRNALNKQVGLLIRNGENLYAVLSPIDSHLVANNLFPSKNEIDRIFREDVGFWGEREGKVGREITFNDVRYTDKLSQHEKLSLHYKRFLILLAGLDHREQLFGKFYPGPQTLDFVSTGFQKKYMRFIHDAERSTGMLPGVKRPHFKDFAEAKNAYMRTGARVIARWRKVMTHSSAPGAVQYDSNGKSYFKAEPAEKFSVAIVYKRGRDFYVSVPVKSKSYRSDGGRTFDARVNLSVPSDYYEVTYLVLDAVKPEELEAYIYDRESRTDHLSYIQFFKSAVKFLREEREYERGTREALANALKLAGIASLPEPIETIVDKAVMTWRAANKGEPLPSEPMDPEVWKLLLNHMWDQVHAKRYAEATEQWADNEQLKPLRLVLTGKDKLCLYCAPRPEEREDRVVPHVWVHAIEFTARKKGWTIKKTSQTWAELPKFAASETTLHEWPGVEEWAGLKDMLTLPEKQELFEVTGQFQHWAAYFFGDKGSVELPEAHQQVITEARFARIVEDWTNIRAKMQKGGYVRNPDFDLPVGVVNREGRYYFLTLHHPRPERWLYSIAPTAEAKKRFHDAFVSRYRNPHFNSTDLVRGADTAWKSWTFYLVPVQSWKPHFNDSEHMGTGVSESKVTESMSFHLKRIKAVWTAGEEHQSGLYKFLLDDFASRFDFDGVLGIDGRVKHFAVSYFQDAGNKCATVKTVYAIIPVDEDGDTPLVENEKTVLMNYIGGGVSYGGRDYFHTIEEARESLNDVEGITRTPEGEYPTPQHPEVEYWFLPRNLPSPTP
jgi:hypothetical protein